MVAGDAAAPWARWAEGQPSVGALSRHFRTRIHTSHLRGGGLGVHRSSAAPATNALAEALGDPIPGVRWAACGASGIGPAAQSAVPQLIEALEDEFLYVRILAAGALGSIGPKAQSAREALRAAATIPPCVTKQSGR
jgi:hypothetical protein